MFWFFFEFNFFENGFHLKSTFFLFWIAWFLIFLIFQICIFATQTQAPDAKMTRPLEIDQAASFRELASCQPACPSSTFLTCRCFLTCPSWTFLTCRFFLTCPSWTFLTCRFCLIFQLPSFFSGSTWRHIAWQVQQKYCELLRFSWLCVIIVGNAIVRSKTLLSWHSFIWFQIVFQ